MANGSEAQGRLLGASAPTHLIFTQGEAVGYLVIIVGHDGDSGAPHLEAVLGLRRQVGARSNLHVSRERSLDCVSPEGDVFWAAVEETVVAEELAQACAFGVEVGHIEGIAFVQQTLVGCGTYEAVGDNAEVLVFYRSETEQRARVYRIANLGFPLVFGVRLNLVVHAPAEETIVAQGVAGYLCAYLWVSHGYGAWRGGETVEHPTAEAALLVNETCVEPQAYGQLPSCRRAAEDAVVGRVGQGCIHFLACLGSSFLQYGCAAEQRIALFGAEAILININVCAYVLRFQVA